MAAGVKKYANKFYAIIDKYSRKYADVSKAVRGVKDELRLYPEMYQEILEDLLEDAIRGHIQDAQHRIRQELARNACAERSGSLMAGSRCGTSVRGAASLQRWLRDYTVDGKPLGQCTRAELIASANKKSAAAGGSALVAKFERRIAGSLGEADKVSDIFDEASTKKLYFQVKDEVDAWLVS